MLKKSNPQHESISALVASQVLSTERRAPKLKIRQLSRTRNSKVFLVIGEGINGPLLAKQLFVGDCRTQYKSLVYAYHVMADGPYRVPKPLAYDQSANILLMEFVEGTACSRIVARFSATLDRNRDCIGRVATWLSHFHARTRTEDGSVEASRRLTAVEASLRKVDKLVSRDAEIVSALQFLQNARAYMDSIRVPICTTHGDCKPENFIVDNASVVGIDLEIDEKGLPYMDVAQFANHIMFLSLRVSGLMRVSRIVQFATHFIDSYAEGDVPFEADVLRWLRVSHYLRYWAAAVARGDIFGRAQAFALKNLLRKELTGVR